MPGTYDYPAEIERDEDGRFVVTFPDFGWGATDGATLDEALAEARDLLRELIAATIRDGGRLPAPSREGAERRLVAPPIQTALKAALYDACINAGASARSLAENANIQESEARRLLDPDRAVSAAALDNALRLLGKQTTLTIDSLPRNADASPARARSGGKEDVGGAPVGPEGSRRTVRASSPQYEKMQVYATNLGTLMQNLLTLELMARKALDKIAGIESIDLSQVRVGECVEIDTLSNWDSLKDTLNQYNGNVSKKHVIDVEYIVELRNALAHGRVFQCGAPNNKFIKLIRFNKPQRNAKNVRVTMSEVMDESWFQKNNNLLSQSIHKVRSASGHEMQSVP